jgi:uncharacterized membrane protein YfcA
LDYYLLLLSFFVGLLVGATSMGGAALMTPVLILVFGVRPTLAVGTDLVFGAITKTAGAWMHWRQGTVDLQVVRNLATSSIPSGVIGVLVVQFLHRRGIAMDAHVRHALGMALVIVAAVLLARSLGVKVPNPFFGALQRHRQAGVMAWGAFVGFAVGLTSVGSGSLITPFLLMLFPKDPARAIGTDVFHAALLVTATASLYAGAGTVEWRLIPTLLAGSMPGVLLGSYLTPRLPVRPLRIGLSVVLLATGLKLV